MIINKYDNTYNFKSTFDTSTGLYIRSGILDSNGIDTGVDPFMASFPELIDIGIMGHCTHGLSGKCKSSGVQCYQHGDIAKHPNMTFDNYKSIIDECEGKTFQVALGGCGDPDQHPYFEYILEYTVSKHIVPNFTTSGFGLTARAIQLAKYNCGAVAVSWYRSEYTKAAIIALVSAEVATNIHYVLGKNTIDEAIYLLETNGFPDGVNAVVFLLHKPVGLGSVNNVLEHSDPRVAKFFNLIDSKNYNFKIGFDSCTVPGILTFMHNFQMSSIETCEAARWSMYITPDMKALPCSFDNQSQKYAVDLHEVGSIQNAWNSKEFDAIRNIFHSSKTRQTCKACKNIENCLGGCPLMSNIQLCK